MNRTTTLAKLLRQLSRGKVVVLCGDREKRRRWSPWRGFRTIADGDDFMVPMTGGYHLSASPGGTQTHLDAIGGVCALNAVDGGYVALARGTNAGSVACFLRSHKRLVFECRVSLASEASAGVAFVGLAQTGQGAAVLADTGDIGNVNCVGFYSAGPQRFDYVFRRLGAIAERPALGPRIPPGQFITLGFAFNGKKTLRFFVERREVAQVPLCAGSFPDGKHLAFTAAVKSRGAAQSLWIDWWRVVQRR